MEEGAPCHLSQGMVTGLVDEGASQGGVWEQGAVLRRQAAGECSTHGRAQQAQTSTNSLRNLS